MIMWNSHLWNVHIWFIVFVINLGLNYCIGLIIIS